MKLFKYTNGDFQKWGVFKNLEEAYSRCEEIDPAYGYLHFTVEEFTIPHYSIHLEPTEDMPFVPDEAEEIREALRAAGVQFHSQLGLKRLRELADEHLLSDPKIDTEAPPEE